MKQKLLLFMTLLSFGFSGVCQYTAIPDSNLELALAFFDDIPNDNQIPTATASAFTEVLNIENFDITDLSGIEAFDNITGIILGYNANLEFADFSVLPQLESISCESCSSLESIDVAGLFDLTDLYMPDAAINSLDLSSNFALQNLNVRANNLITLDLSLNINLVTLDAYNNGGGSSLILIDLRNGNNANITSFDTDFNGNLSCLFVDDPSAAYLSGWTIDAQTTLMSESSECTLSVSEVDNEIGFQVYPNPVSNNLNVRLNGNQTAQLEIYSVTGKLVHSSELLEGSNAINMSHLSDGIYMAKLFVDDHMEIKKLVIQ
ncbi:T9SS type A sorting domain-containing protein [Mangrovimonas sp. ST2L15]|uniref:T9SS type A sorting domain-containing protein n=1 Tax=Mangrovimonas sp. ST2L15 TaxID=1645916 RepID=UPI0009E7D5C0|nr:T9SS type A sorting domain-containing protein [Mangrovimonas sp. ST2L15]